LFERSNRAANASASAARRERIGQATKLATKTASAEPRSVARVFNRVAHPEALAAGDFTAEQVEMPARFRAPRTEPISWPVDPVLSNDFKHPLDALDDDVDGLTRGPSVRRLRYPRGVFDQRSLLFGPAVAEREHVEILAPQGKQMLKV